MPLAAKIRFDEVLTSSYHITKLICNTSFLHFFVRFFYFAPFTGRNSQLRAELLIKNAAAAKSALGDDLLNGKLAFLQKLQSALNAAFIHKFPQRHPVMLLKKPAEIRGIIEAAIG